MYIYMLIRVLWIFNIKKKDVDKTIEHKNRCCVIRKQMYIIDKTMITNIIGILNCRFIIDRTKKRIIKKNTLMDVAYFVCLNPDPQQL